MTKAPATIEDVAQLAEVSIATVSRAIHMPEKVAASTRQKVDRAIAITHYVAGVGTSGTFIGTARRLRELNPGIRLIAMHPDGPYHGLEGMKHMASALVPAIYDPSVADENVTVATEDAYAMVKRLAREEGLLVGISAGANVHAALRVARTLEQGTVVTILCDGADKYLSARFWDEE